MGRMYLLGLVVALVSAPEGPDLPVMPQAMMQIPWSEFRGLLNELEELRKGKEKDIRLSEKAPVPWSVSEAAYDAALLDTGAVQVTASLKVSVWETESWVQIPVIGNSVAVTWASLDESPVSLLSDANGKLLLLLRGAGEHVLELEFYVQTNEQEGNVSFEFPCAESALTRMDLHLPYADTALRSDAATNTRIARTGTGLDAALTFRRTDTIAVDWKLPLSEQPAQPPIEPRLACTSWTLATLTESYVTCKTYLRYEVLRGEVNGFAINLPGNTSVLNVTGEGAAWSHAQTDGVTTVEVKINHALTDAYDLQVSFEAPYEGEQAGVPLAVPTGVIRETAYVGVAVVGNVEIHPNTDSLGLIRIDTGELPVELRAQSTTPLLFAFRHGEGDRNLSLAVRKLKDLAVPDSAIDQASLTTVIGPDGLVITRAVYDVRNSARQFLRIDLGEDAEVWSARVGGQLVKPAQESDPGHVLIPLYKSAEKDRGLSTFPVEVLYKQNMKSTAERATEFSMQAPTLDLLVSSTVWEVFVPASRRVVDSSGDFEWGRYSPAVRVELTAENRPTTLSRRDRIYRLKEGVERFLVGDINDPSRASNGGAPRYTGDPLTPEQAGTARATVAGVLPVPIAMTTEGWPEYFSRGMATQGQTLTLTVRTWPAWWLNAAAALARAAYPIGSVLAGMGLGRGLLAKLGVRRKLRSAVFLFALAGVVALGLHWQLGFSRAMGLWFAALGFMLALTPQWLAWLQWRLRRAHAAMCNDAHTPTP